MAKILYKINEVGKAKYNNVKRIRLGITIKINKTFNGYSQEFEDDNFKIKVVTNINDDIKDLKKENFKLKNNNDNTMTAKMNLVSNYYFGQVMNLEKKFYKCKMEKDSYFFVITFYPKNNDILGKINLMKLKNKTKKTRVL